MGRITLKWYASCFTDKTIMNALIMTLQITLCAAVLSTLIGTLAAIGISAMKKRGTTLMLGATNIPLLNADIVTGISMMLLFVFAGQALADFSGWLNNQEWAVNANLWFDFSFNLGFLTLLIAHITFNIPYVILSVMPRLKQLNPSVYEAALDLGASPWQAFFKVVFPDLLPGVMSGFLMAFTMSLDDFIITHFTKGPGVDTLSTKIYTEVKKGIKPEMYALSTLIFMTVLVLLILVNKAPKPKEKQ